MHQLIDTLKKLLKLHQSLHQIAIQKTDVLKKDDMASLKNIMNDEQKHLLAIQKIDKEREIAVYKLVSGHEILGDKPTISDCINLATGEEKTKLKELQEHLVRCITEIKERNELNQQLLQQSLQFINLSLEMLSPEPPEINYQHPKQNGTIDTKTRFQAFDSKA